MGIRRKLMAMKQKEVHFVAASLPPRYTRLSTDEGSQGPHVRKGFVPVVVGGVQGPKERFFIPTHFLSHPIIVSMLESWADEFGYGQEGVLQIHGEPDHFREIIGRLE